MAIDIRATVSCSLGTLISGSLNDDYVQGTGLIKCRGSVEISGLITPALGTAVEISYTRGGVTTYLPRKLRVMSSFADPYRRTTRVELGCKLTYLADLRESLKWNAFDDPINKGTAISSGSTAYSQSWSRLPTLEDTKRAIVPMNAQSMMAKCLDALGITADRNPLTSRFSRDEFDFNAGYVQVLSDLLVSECYVGYLNRNEVLQVLSLNEEGGTGPVVTREQIIDLGPIGAGQLPGEAVTVSYTTFRLKYDEDADIPDPNNPTGPSWAYSRTSSTSERPVSYTIPGTQTRAVAVFQDLQTSETTTTYREITTPTGERVNVVGSRVTTKSSAAASVLGEIATAFLSNGIAVPNNSLTETTRETYSYDAYGNETLSVSERRGTGAHVAGAVGLPMVLPDKTAVSVNYGGSFLLERQEVETVRYGNSVQTTTRTYGPWYRTISGQQTIAGSRDSFTTAGQVSDYINAIADGEYLLDATVQASTTGYRGQRGPSPTAIPASAGAQDGADPDNDYRTDSTAELALAVGSATAQRRIELSIPYVQDDIYMLSSSGGGGGGSGFTFRARLSRAGEQARLFGRVQNKLLLGNRSGMSLQTRAGTLPNQPFGPFVVQANGLSALYRTNGSSWTFDANGIVHSTDALFWGAVGGTGDFWFPVAPGITSLPTTPAVVNTAPSAVVGSVATVGSNAQTTLNTAFPAAANGQGVLNQGTGDYWKLSSGTWVNVGPTPGPTITTSAVVPPWNETVELEGRVRSAMTVTSLPYALTLPVVPLTLTTRATATARRVLLIDLPATSLAVGTAAPLVAQAGVVVNLPAISLGVSALAPTAGVGDTVVSLPVVSVNVAALAPDVAQFGVALTLPVTSLEVATVAPAVAAAGSIVSLPATTLNVTATAPAVAEVGPTDPNWSSVSLLLSFNGTNGSTAITDSSTNANTITVFGSAQITTSDPKFGTGSLSVGSGNYIQTPASSLFQFGTGDLTVDFWVNPTSVGGNQGVFTFGGTSTGLFLALFVNSWHVGTTGSGGTNMGLAATGWQHVAIARSGTSLRLFINGTQLGSTLTNSTNLSDNQLKIGWYFSTAYPLTGKIDEFRVTKGVARYTSNFTAPTAAFPRS